MAIPPSWPGVNGLATTTDARKNLAGLIAKDASGNVRTGIFPGGAAAIISARSDMNIDIAAFTGVTVQFGGPILLSNDGVAQLPSVLVSPGAGTNYYVVYAKQNESTSPGTDANTNRVFGAQLSTVSFAAARGALPAGALEVGTVEMPTGKTATNNSGVVITPTFQYTAAAGGVVWVRNSTELAAWTPANGAVTYRIDNGLFYQRAGGAWRNDGLLPFGLGNQLVGSAPSLDTPLLIQGATRAGTANGSSVLSTVFPNPFPNGVLTVVPVPGDASTTTKMCITSNVSLTGFDVQCLNSSGAGIGAVATRYNWIAIGW